MEVEYMTDSQLKSLIAGIRVTHSSGIPELDQYGGPNNLVCHGHGWGYPPPYPCQTIILCNELEKRLDVVDHPECPTCRSFRVSRRDETGRQISYCPDSWHDWINYEGVTNAEST